MDKAAGIALVAMTALALAWVNSPWAEWYGRAFTAPVLHVINDGLMVIFFLMVALEIKREVLEGELSHSGQVLLPVATALGGMAVPALIFWAFNAGQPGLRGWAIPTATDIAFSLGILALLARRLPPSLRLFLTTLAIVDDLGAILIIAVFYSGTLAWGYLAGVAALTLALLGLGRLRVASLWPYLVLGVGLWACMLGSGVHATIAGVIVGLCIPLAAGHRLERGLQPWVAFLILPLFALANAGLSLTGLGGGILADPLALGAGLGLFLGKQSGVFASGWLVVAMGWARLPAGGRWSHFYGVALLSGIGFTMSLFIADLAFADRAAMDASRLGILVGSALSAVAGFAVLVVAARR